ncbi:MAG: thioredoxin-dependent thiol peroxidase [Salibacteraceae bacterium]
MTHLKVGDEAPAINGVDQDGKTLSLEQYKGKKVILYFYPRDNTPTCTTEACNLRDNYEELTNLGYDVIGVSDDSAKKHTNFINKYELPFRLLADTEQKTLNAYGVWGPKKFMGRDLIGTHRTTFVIDEAGKIEQIIAKVKAKEHTKQILENAPA